MSTVSTCWAPVDKSSTARAGPSKRLRAVKECKSRKKAKDKEAVKQIVLGHNDYNGAPMQQSVVGEAVFTEGFVLWVTKELGLDADTAVRVTNTKCGEFDQSEGMSDWRVDVLADGGKVHIMFVVKSYLRSQMRTQVHRQLVEDYPTGLKQQMEQAGLETDGVRLLKMPVIINIPDTALAEFGDKAMAFESMCAHRRLPILWWKPAEFKDDYAKFIKEIMADPEYLHQL